MYVLMKSRESWENVVGQKGRVTGQAYQGLFIRIPLDFPPRAESPSCTCCVSDPFSFKYFLCQSGIVGGSMSRSPSPLWDSDRALARPRENPCYGISEEWSRSGVPESSDAHGLPKSRSRAGMTDARQTDECLSASVRFQSQCHSQASRLEWNSK